MKVPIADYPGYVAEIDGEDNAIFNGGVALCDIASYCLENNKQLAVKHAD